MSPRDCQNKEIVRGPLRLEDTAVAPPSRPRRYRQRPARVFTAAELRLDADMAVLVGAVRGADGGFPTRGFQRVLYGEAFPWRILARWFVAARRAGTEQHQLSAIVGRLDRFVGCLYEAEHDKAA